MWSSVRLPWIVGTGVLLWLLWLAGRFYLERTASFDSAWFTWLMIDSGEPQSFLGRYGSWFAQLVPVALIRSHADLETVLRSYSLCLMLTHVVAFAIIAFHLRDEAGTIALPLTLITGLHLMFYYGTSELNQGLSLTVLVWVLMRKAMDATARRARMGWGTAVLLLSAWTSFYHQVLLLPLIFAAVMELLARRRRRDGWTWAVPMALVSWYVVRIKLLATSSYEQERMPGVGDVLAQLQHLRDLPSTAYLLEVFPKFKAFWLLLALTIAMVVSLKRYALGMWTVVFSVGLLVLILITDRAAGSPTMYENFYPLGALCWSMVFGSVFAEARARYPRAMPTLLVVLAVAGCAQVHRGHYTVSDKVAFGDRLARQVRGNGIQKAYLEEACYPWTYAYSTWQLPFETALISAVHGPRQAASVYCAPHQAAVDTVLHKELMFLGPAWMPLWFTTDHLNADYFRMDPGGYRRLNSAFPDSALAAFPWSAISLIAPPVDVRMVPGRFTVVEVAVRNASGLPLRSLSEQGEPLRFRYAVYEQEGKLYSEPGLRSALECDVIPNGEYLQGVIIERPSRAGRYRVELRLSLEEPTRMQAPGASFWIDVARFR